MSISKSSFGFLKWDHARWLRKILAGFSLVLVAFVFVPAARAQFGLDPCCAIISVGLNTISGLLKTVVGKPLSAIQQARQQAADFEQQVVYPLSAITQAHQLAGELESQLQRMSQLQGLAVNSATLATPQQLENTVLSRDPQAIGAIGQQYAAVYGGVPAVADAPQPLRDLVDMTDAEAQAALKKALILDAQADIELATASEIGSRVQSAAPGSAAILQVEAEAWVLRANAYTQLALAELARVRSIDLAGQCAQLKFAAGDVSSLQNTATKALDRGAH
jgi:hypothetical protein